MNKQIIIRVDSEMQIATTYNVQCYTWPYKEKYGP